MKITDVTYMVGIGVMAYIDALPEELEAGMYVRRGESMWRVDGIETNCLPRANVIGRPAGLVLRGSAIIDRGELTIEPRNPYAYRLQLEKDAERVAETTDDEVKQFTEMFDQPGTWDMGNMRWRANRIGADLLTTRAERNEFRDKWHPDSRETKSERSRRFMDEINGLVDERRAVERRLEVVVTKAKDARACEEAMESAAGRAFDRLAAIRTTGAVSVLRGWRNDGADGESAHEACDAIEGARSILGARVGFPRPKEEEGQKQLDVVLCLRCRQVTSMSGNYIRRRHIADCPCQHGAKQTRILTQWLPGLGRLVGETISEGIVAADTFESNLRMRQFLRWDAHLMPGEEIDRLRGEWCAWCEKLGYHATSHPAKTFGFWLSNDAPCLDKDAYSFVALRQSAKAREAPTAEPVTGTEEVERGV